MATHPASSSGRRYTLQRRDAGNGRFVLAFEQRDEASRFAELLHAQGFDMADPTEWQAGELSDFCDSADLGLGLVPQGTFLVPPEQNKYDADAFEAQEHDDAAAASEEEQLREVRAKLERIFDL